MAISEPVVAVYVDQFLSTHRVVREYTTVLPENHRNLLGKPLLVTACGRLFVLSVVRTGKENCVECWR